MHISAAAHRAIGLAALTGAVAMSLTHTAAAEPVVAGLRVEGPDGPLASERSYLTDTTRVQTDSRSACGGSGDVKTLTGPTALGQLTRAARADSRLRPLGVSDRFSFGLFVCALGRLESSSTAYWLYKVNHVSPEVGADQYTLDDGDAVLWFFQDTTPGSEANTGDELELRAPVFARLGRTFGVTALAWSSAGQATRAAGAKIVGETVQTSDANGRARVYAGEEGWTTLRAERGTDVPSAEIAVCVGSHVADCPKVRGERILGTTGADSIEGTLGADVIRARAGDDVIDVRSGDRDRVSCGAGRDLVRAGRDDRVDRNCERVVRS
jgi:Ca2+-binding RTX toxin-like protein